MAARSGARGKLLQGALRRGKKDGEERVLTTSTVVCLVSQEEVGEGGDGDRTLAGTAGKKWKKITVSWRPAAK